MAQELEIEFKNVLTKQQYENLLKKYHVTEEMIVRQRNHYFDTKDFHLKKLFSGLRIRETKKRIVCTLKERTSANIHLETTDELSKEQAELMLSGKGFFAESVQAKLLQLEIPIAELRVFGTLTTDRVELSYKGGTIVFDHSFYLNCDDYEVEYETDEESLGKEIFEDFLKENAIPKQVADKKIARFMNALKKEKG
ncbi:CYTH domain-containing protein [Lysinibacillus sp. SGAir0095]|uniref:CYTH domain-containing protein n=1 Tax=Lysinibacillus sp. SGAir0095 TaxID=2070463 RepID=UPI0010CD28CA|nr:CYTH domain-containing protein [Lysinibacillus sp. SGAir0095]QCR34412.1 CYTH domain-containing protein [Lysinibacillus sp. SGAir0095]